MKQLLFKLVIQRFELNLNYSNARLNRLSGELHSLMDSRPILIYFSGGIMAEFFNFFILFYFIFTPDISSTWCLCDYFLWAQQGELIYKIFSGMMED